MIRNLFRRSNTAYPQRKCFFCHTTSVILPPFQPNSPNSPNPDAGPAAASSAPSSSALTISTGTADNWFCSSCQCTNTYNPDGSFKDQWLRPMWDEQWNQDRNQLVKHQATNQARLAALNPSTRDASPFAAFSTRVNQNTAAKHFCHTCQTNQTLQVHLLADYLPDESHPDYQYKLQALPEYQASVAQRYPTACEQCAPSIQQTIHQRDQVARSWTLAQWLQRKQSPDITSHASGSSARPVCDDNASDENDRASQAASSASIHRARIRTEIRWYRQAASWSITTLGVYFVYGSILAWPLRAQLVLERAQHNVSGHPAHLGCFALGFFALISLIRQGVKWDPTFKRVTRAKSRGVRPQVSGLDEWIMHQRIAFTLRSLALFATVVRILLAPPFESALALQTIGAAGLGVELLLLLLSIRRLSVRMPAPLRLVSRPLRAASNHYDTQLGSLSLDDTAPSSQPKPDPLFRAEPQRDADGDLVMRTLDDDDDDDLPPPQPQPNSFNIKRPTQAYDFQFGKQQFWEPQQPTGLEDVFGRAVRLNDSDEPSSSSSQPSSKWKSLFGGFSKR